LTGVVLWVGRALPLAKDEWAVTGKNTAVRLLFLVGIILAWWLAERMREWKLQRWWRLLALGLVWMDGTSHAPQPHTVTRLVYAEELGVEPSGLRSGQARAMLNWPMRKDLGNNFLPEVEEDYVNRRRWLASDCNLLVDIPKVDGFLPLQLREFEMCAGVLLYSVDAPLPHPPPLLDFLGVAQISSTNGGGGWEVRPGALPLLTAGQRVVFADGAGLTVALRSTNFNPRGEVFLLPPDKKVVGERAAAAVKFSAVTYAAEKITAQFDASAPTVAVVAQAYYHPWHAYVDGVRVPVVRANFAFQAVPIPAGAHEFRLVYEDEKFRLGAGISFASLAVCAGLWVRTRREELPST
jgi:hypothetical protein